MVFTTIVNFIRSKSCVNSTWRKRKFLSLSAHYFGRKRNCIGLAYNNVHRGLVYATKARKLKKDDMKELYDVRIAAGCSELGISLQAFRIGLARNRIMLNSKSLADCAIYEPKTFESLGIIARERCVQDGITGVENREFNNRVYYYHNEQAMEKERDDGKTPANYSAKFKNKVQY